MGLCYTHTCTRMHARTHTLHACMHTHTRTHTHTHTHTHTRKDLRHYYHCLISSFFSFSFFHLLSSLSTYRSLDKETVSRVVEGTYTPHTHTYTHTTHTLGQGPTCIYTCLSYGVACVSNSKYWCAGVLNGLSTICT